MSVSTERHTSLLELDSTLVAEYLRQNPDFFEHHPEVLLQLELSQQADPGTASLIERQVRILREQNHHLQQRMLELMAVARDNDTLSERMQKLTIALMQAGDLRDLLAILRDVMTASFGADAIALRLIGAHPADLPDYCNTSSADDRQLVSHFDHLITTRKPLCGRLTQDQLGFLFSPERAEQIGSAVLVPVGEAELLGILAVGSSDPDKFQHDMGTVFLTHLGELLAALIHHHSGNRNA